MEMEGQERVVTRKPHFFKILLGDFSHCLGIPPAFTKHISDEASNKAILKGPGGGQWQVNISKGNCNETYFHGGWKAFVKDHCLHEHDFLVFRYNGGMHFSVRIFDKTACEREDAFRTKNSKEPAYEVIGKRDGSKEINKDFGCCHTLKSKKRKWEQFESGQYKPSTQMVDITNEVQLHQPTPRVKEKVCHSPSSFTSKFPFFEKCLPKSAVMKPHLIHIPTSFLDYLPKTKNKFILQDPSGRNWEVFTFRGRHTSISGGFPAFCRGNNLKEGDTCIFELVDISMFRVHVYPVSKDMSYKKSRGNGHWTDQIKKVIGYKTRSRVQKESGQNEPSALKVETKNKQEFRRFAPSVKENVCQSLDLFSSKFPFFSKFLPKISVTMPCKLIIPKSFYDYLPQNKSKFTLQDPNGKNWELAIAHRDKIFFSRGFGAFCRGNNLKEGDICMFELLDESTFRVHIFKPKLMQG